MKFQRGFTLIELVVVIAIIGVLAGFLVSNFMNAREKARDSQRKSDVKQIQKALEVYRQDNNQFPTTLPSPSSCWSSLTSCAGNVYMSKFPKEPVKTNSSDGSPVSYYYKPGTTGVYRLSYTLSTCIENVGDTDTVTCPADFSSYAGYTCATKCFTVTDQ
jgi:type II secretion system protein G